MWRTLKWSSHLLFWFCAGVFAACTAAGLLVTWLHSSTIKWPVILSVASIGTVIFAVRVYPLLRDAHRAACIRHEERWRERIHRIAEALTELEHCMARLSAGDLSLYHTLVAQSGGEGGSVMTTVGSPNHHVLVQMTDLKLAVPVERKVLGQAPHTIEMVRYGTTPHGMVEIPKLLKGALRIRHAQAAA